MLYSERSHKKRIEYIRALRQVVRDKEAKCIWMRADLSAQVIERMAGAFEERGYTVNAAATSALAPL